MICKSLFVDVFLFGGNGSKETDCQHLATADGWAHSQ